MAIQPLEISAVVQALEPSPDPSADFLSRRSVKLALFMLGDIISLTLAYYAAVRLSKVIFHVAQAAFGPSTYPLLFVPFCAGMFYVMDGYGVVELRRPEREIELAFKAVSFSLLSLLATNAILLKGEVFSRYFILLWYLFTLGTVLCIRFGLRSAYGWCWRQGRGRSRALFLGELEELEHFQRLLSVQHHRAYCLATAIVPPHLAAPEEATRLIELTHWKSVTEENKVQVVVIGRSMHKSFCQAEMITYCQLRRLNVVLLGNVPRLRAIHQELDYFTGSTYLSSASLWNSGVQRFCKRCIDLFFGVIGSLITVLLTPVIALLLTVEDPGPVFYRREIVSGCGKRLWHWKFRTMVQNADAILQKDPELRAKFAENHKLQHDPRVLRIGRFLRKYSIDELPQLFGLLSGSFSLVGPRGISSEESVRYGGFLAKRLSVKPGITGYWQVMGRQLISYEDRVRMDEFYIDHWSSWLDLYIIGKTFGKLFRPEGAY